MLAGLGGQAEQAGAAECQHAAADADVEVVAPGIEGQADDDLLAVVDGLTGRLVGGDDQEPDLAESELVFGILGVQGENLFGRL